MERKFRVGEWLVEPDLCRISRDGHTVRVRAKVMDLLVYLANRRGAVVSKDELLQDVWGTDAVSESALTRTMTELRQALADEVNHPSILETIPKRGYRLIAPVAPSIGSDTPSLGEPDGNTDGSHSRTTARRSAVVIASGLALAAVGIGAAYLQVRRPFVGTAGQAMRVTVQPPSGVSIAELAAPSSMAISPDGQWIAFRGTSDEPNRSGLYLRFTGDIEARRVGEGGSPFFSPDSEWLAFVQDGAIQKMPVRSGDLQRICTVGPHGIRGGSWGDDGTIVFASGEGLGLRRVSADGGEPVAVTAPPAGWLHYFPHMLPGSRAALLTVIEGVGDSRQHVAVVSLDTGHVRPLLTGSFARYLPGFLIYRRGASLYAVGFDLARLEIRGEERQALEQVNYYRGSGSTAFDVSASGALLYVPGPPRAIDSELAWLRRDGTTELLVAARAPYSSPALDPEQRRVAVHIGPTLEETDVWLYDIGHRAWTRLTHGLQTSGRIVWSGDGKSIFFSSGRSGFYKVYRLPSQGGEAEALTDGIDWDYAGDVHGPVLVFQRQVKPAVHDLITLRLEPARQMVRYLQPHAQAGVPRFSPDGRWVAYDSMEAGPNQIFVRAYPGGEPHVGIAAEGFGPRWSRDGKTLFYRRNHEIWAVAMATDSVLSIGRPELVIKSDLLSPQLWQDGIEPSGDGQRFLIARRFIPERRERLLVYVPQWATELQQRAAVPR